MAHKPGTALITGAARGIGQVTALLLAGQGLRVGLADLNPAVSETAGKILASGGEAMAVEMNVGDPAGINDLVETIVEAFGPIDILINNAGIVNNIAPIEKMSDEAWDRELNINLSGAFRLIRKVVGPMAEQGWGRIVNISSIGAYGLHYQSAYAASKAGLLGLTRTVTKEFASSGVTCNAILPGIIETENVRAMPEEIRETFLAATPAGRFGTMAEVASLIAYLVSEEAGFINGAEINIDGGLQLGNVSLGSRKANR